MRMTVKPMTSQQFSLPSGALSGEVQQCDHMGVWRVVLTPTGIPVQDRRQQSCGTDDTMQAMRINGVDLMGYIKGPASFS